MDNIICHFEIPATDLKAAREFYGTLFSWQFTEAGEYVFVQTSTQPGALAGGIARHGADRSTPVVYVQVKSVEESIARALTLGGQVSAPRTAVARIGWFAVIRDPQGSLIGLFERDESAT